MKIILTAIIITTLMGCSRIGNLVATPTPEATSTPVPTATPRILTPTPDPLAGVPEHTREAIESLQNENWEEAVAHLDKAVGANPEYRQNYVYRGTAHRNLGNYEDSIKDYGIALDLKPDDHVAYAARGITYATFGHPNSALSDFSKVIRLRPSNLEGYWLRGGLHYAMQEYDLALEDFLRVLTIDPSHKGAAELRAEILELRKTEN